MMFTPEALDYIDFINPYLKLATWDLHFCIIPRKCVISDKLIWLTHAYKGRRVISNTENYKVENYYMSVNEFLIWSLKEYE